MMSMVRTRGYTLLEAIIASVILAGLLILSLITILASTRPITDTSIRAEVTAQGSETLRELVRSLQGGVGTSSRSLSVGSLVVSGTATLTPDSSDDDAGAPEVFTGRAIRFHKATGWNNATEEPVTEGTSYFAFEADPSPRNVQTGVTYLRLVRVLPGSTQKVVLLRDIESTSAGDPPSSPFFRLTTPSDLEIRFTVGRQVDFQDNQRKYVRVEFSETVNLRNLNQY